VELEASLDAIVGPLWDNSSSSANGLHDSVSETIASGFDHSLKLVRVESLVISLSTEGGYFGPPKRKYRGSFALAGQKYTLSITDPAISQQYGASQNGSYNVGPAILCISLGEPFNGSAYRLVCEYLSVRLIMIVFDLKLLRVVL
jgi:hypothetical protein